LLATYPQRLEQKQAEKSALSSISLFKQTSQQQEHRLKQLESLLTNKQGKSRSKARTSYGSDNPSQPLLGEQDVQPKACCNIL
jgi:hypothetical protein